jgi:hypothetical protein
MLLYGIMEFYGIWCSNTEEAPHHETGPNCECQSDPVRKVRARSLLHVISRTLKSIDIYFCWHLLTSIDIYWHLLTSINPKNTWQKETHLIFQAGDLWTTRCFSCFFWWIVHLRHEKTRDTLRDARSTWLRDRRVMAMKGKSQNDLNNGD